MTSQVPEKVNYLVIPMEIDMTMRTLMTRLIREEEGAAATEYAILVAFVAAAVAAAVALFDLRTIFTTVSQNVLGWINSAPTAGGGG
jgi:Flp pilus assembly pilin Flp